ncbi:MAG: class I SAM-dependent methyltransferase [Bryobacteraceae bacterium]
MQYFNGSQRDGYADYKGSEPILRAEFRRLLRDLEESGTSSGKLLEIGCAYGFLLAEAQPKFDTFGFEICADAVESCRARGLNVECGPANDASMGSHGPFDVCIMLDVIEHLEQPHLVFEMIYRHLKPGGRVVISTGDWGSLLARAMGKNWRLMTPPQHLFFFTQRALTRMLERIGFSVRQITRPTKYVPLSLILFQFSRLVGISPKRIELPNWMAAPVNLHDALRAVAIRLAP